MEINNIYELFSQTDEDFVENSYRILLGREPDAGGKSYYQGRLMAGYSKSYVIYQLYLSPEANPDRHNIPGLKQIIRDEKRANNRLWNIFKPWARCEKEIHERISTLEYRLRKLIFEETNKNCTVNSQTESYPESISRKITSNLSPNSKIICTKLIAIIDRKEES